MKDVFEHLKVGDKLYPFVFNINVIQAISEKYGKKDGLTVWSNAIEPQDGSEPDIGALVFFCKEAINEGIDMENDPEDSHFVKREIPRPFINEKQAGRIISVADDFQGEALDLVKKSYDIGKEKNVMTEQNPNPTME